MFFEDFDAFKVKFDSLCHHSIPLDDHKHLEDPVIKSGINIYPFCNFLDLVFRMQSFVFLQLFVYSAGKITEIMLVYVEERVLNTLEFLLIVLNHKRRVIEEIVQISVGLRKTLVAYAQRSALEKMVIKLLP